MPIVSFTRVERRRISVFLSCLIIAIFAWLFFALSNDYIYLVKSEISFKHPPVNKAYNPLQEDTITLKVQGTGWQLLFERLKSHPKVINVSLEQLNSSNFVTVSSQLQDINHHFESNQRVISALPDTLFFDFTTRVIKKVPVKLIYNISFAKAFGISGPIKLEPDTVVITGAAQDLKEIEFWPTDSLSLKSINSPINKKLSFQEGIKKNIDVYPKSVKVGIPVDEFTEKIIEIPIEIVNNPGWDIKIIPERAKITILTALSNFPSIDRGTVKASVDFENWTERRFRELPVNLTVFPPFSKLVKQEPQTVDFIIKR